jgi:hypothetical protein
VRWEGVIDVSAPNAGITLVSASRINARPLASRNQFQPPSDTGLNPREPDAFGDGHDRHFVNALDGSAGRISIRWGKTGKGGVSSSGLN